MPSTIRKKLIPLIYPAIIIALMAACLSQYDPYAHLLTTEKPNEVDVIGTYVLTEQTLTTNGLDFLQGEPAKIEILPEGRFTAKNFPTWQESPGGRYEFNQLITVDGTWKIEMVGGVYNGSTDGNYKKVWGLDFSRTIDSASFTGDRPPYGLIFTYGDPDRGTVMIFRFEK